MAQQRSAQYDATIRATTRPFALSVQVVDDRTGHVLEQLNPEPGSTVDVDRSRAQRRQLTLQLEDPTGALVPEAPTDLLAPTSSSHHVVVVKRGVAYPATTVADSVTGSGFGSTGTLLNAIAASGGLTLP